MPPQLQRSHIAFGLSVCLFVCHAFYKAGVLMIFCRYFISIFGQKEYENVYYFLNTL